MRRVRHVPDKAARHNVSQYQHGDMVLLLVPWLVFPSCRELVAPGRSHNRPTRCVFPSCRQLFPAGPHNRPTRCVFPSCRQLFPAGPSHNRPTRCVFPSCRQLFPAGPSHSRPTRCPSPCVSVSVSCCSVRAPQAQCGQWAVWTECEGMAKR